MVAVAMETVSIGPQGFTEILHESLRALRGRTVAGPGDLNRELVAQYFSDRSLADGDTLDDIVASASHTYTRMLQAGSSEFLNAPNPGEPFSVIDFGCGDASLLRTLRLWGFTGRYVGYDINRIAIARLTKLTTATNSYLDTIPEHSADVVFLINVLAYTSDGDIPDLLKTVQHLTTHNGTLIIADPWPSWRWETRFDGLRLRLRRLNDVESILNDLGMRLDNAWLAAVGNIGKYRILPFAWLGAWRHDS
jgi:SAM-dependent methyltransferase